jgi:hypothetical protein
MDLLPYINPVTLEQSSSLKTGFVPLVPFVQQMGSDAFYDVLEHQLSLPTPEAKQWCERAGALEHLL